MWIFVHLISSYNWIIANNNWIIANNNWIIANNNWIEKHIFGIILSKWLLPGAMED